MQKGGSVFLLVVAVCITAAVHAQQKDGYRKMLRVYEDNDIINITGKWTDQGYTNGTRLDYFFIKNKPARFFLDRIMPKAGDSGINTYGWSLMQVMITPKNIAIRIPDRSDYPYSGALFATHSLHAANPIKKYNWQTEWMLGVMGPPALARQTQEFAHKMVAYIQPMGWDYQLKTDLLLNVNVAGEKELAHINKVLEWIGGAGVFAGTALNGASLYSLIRFGKMEPYFNGYISQFANKKGSGRHQQLYFVLRPSVEWALTNAMIDGGIINRRHERIPEEDSTYSYDPAPGKMERNRVVAKLNYGLVGSWGRMSISFTQTFVTRMVKGTRAQEIGNISCMLAF